MSKTEIVKSRNLTADFVKGILILCVLYGHSVSMVNSLRDVSWVDSPVNIFVTSFEMPLFILISGYFMYFSLKKGAYGKVLWKRILSIGIPLAIWEGIPAVVRFVETTVSGGFSVVNLLKIPYACVFPGKLWFLSAYLICSVLVIGVEWLGSKLKKNTLRIAVCVILYAGITVGMQFVRYSISSVQFMFGFFLLGYLLSKYSLLEKKGIRIAVVVLAVLFFALYPFYKPEHSFYLLPYIKNIRQDILVMLYRFVLSVCGCSSVYILGKLICTKAEKNVVTVMVGNLGQKTLEIYILSMYIQELLCLLLGALIGEKLSIITNWTAPLLYGPMFLAVMLASCLLVCWVVRKLPFAQKLLFGR